MNRYRKVHFRISEDELTTIKTLGQLTYAAWPGRAASTDWGTNLVAVLPMMGVWRTGPR